MLWKVMILVFSIFGPYFLGKELSHYDWWSELVIVKLPYWVQGIVGIAIVIVVVAICCYLLLGILWLAKKVN